MAKEATIETLRQMIRENDCPFFTAEELTAELDRAAGDVNLAAYNCCVSKAEATGISTSGLTLESDADYWLRLAARYRPVATCTMK